MIFANEKYVQEQVNPLIDYMQKLAERQNLDTATLTENFIGIQNRVSKLENGGDGSNTELKAVLEAMQLEIEEQKEKIEYLKKVIEDTLALVQKVIHPAPTEPKTTEEELSEIEEKFAKEPQPPKIVNDLNTGADDVAYCLFCKTFRKMINIKTKETRMGRMNQGPCITCGRILNKKLRHTK